MQIGVESSRAVENKRVFVVEPEEITRAALQFMLHDEYETHEVRDLQSAFLRSRERRPDLILLGGHGPQAVEEIRRNISGVKIILIQDAACDPAFPELLRLGVDEVLLKPLRLEAVRRKVEECLSPSLGR